MNTTLLTRIHQRIAQYQKTGLHRRRPVCVDEKNYLNFSSNDYLSLTSDNRLKMAWQKGCELYPVGSGGSPLLSGYHSTHQQLERAFAEALGVDDCLFFSSGYAANLGLMRLFAQLKVQVYIDKAMHASVYDGLAFSGINVKRYKHCDVNDLEKKLLPGLDSVIMTESVFSMSGQIASISLISKLAQKHHIDLFVDEAHAFGVLGPQGLGLVKALHLTQEQVPLRVIPLGKAFASTGAIIAGHGVWIEALLQSARSYIYSTSPSPAHAYGLLKTLEIIRESDARRLKLLELIAYFREAIQNSGLIWRDSESPIQQLQLGCPNRAQQIADKLYKKSIICMSLRQPTVSKQETGLRVILNYNHQPEDIDYLLRCL